MRKLLLITAVVGFLIGAFICGTASAKTLTLDSSTLVFRGEVDSKSVSSLIYKIMSLKGNKVTIFISSPGGSVLHGSSLIDFMKASGKKFTCVADFAASMAFSIFQQCDKRYVTASGILMQHQSSWGVTGKDLSNKQFIKLLNKLNLKNDTETANALKMKVRKYIDMTAHDLWLFGRFAVRHEGYRFADDVVYTKCTRKLLRSRIKEVRRSGYGNMTIMWSGCPIIESPVTIDGNEYISTKSTWNTQYIKEINLMKGE